MAKGFIPVSVKMSSEEKMFIEEVAKRMHETVSAYGRRVMLEAAATPLSTRKEVMVCLMDIGIEMACLSADNSQETIDRINRKGSQICQILSFY